MFDWISKKLGADPTNSTGENLVATEAPGMENTPPVDNPVSKLDLESRVTEAVRMVYDPEIPVNV